MPHHIRNLCEVLSAIVVVVVDEQNEQKSIDDMRMKCLKKDLYILMFVKLNCHGPLFSLIYFVCHFSAWEQ